MADEELDVAPLEDKPVEAPKARLIPVSAVRELENVRSSLGDIESFAENIRIRGLLHPIVVRPVENEEYELIVGQRRLAAFRFLGREEIPAIVHAATDEDLLAEMVSENLWREPHTALDEARTMKRMMDTFSWSQTRVAQALGVHRTQVSKRLSLLNLPDTVQEKVADGSLTASHAEVIAAVEKPESQEELAELAVKKDAPVSKLTSYASKIRERDAEEEAAATPAVEVLDADVTLQMITAADMVPLPRLVVRDDISSADRAKATLYILLRNSNDEEMLDVLNARHNTPFTQLWTWVDALDDDEVQQMIDTMLRRWLGAAHRYPTFPPTLRERYGSQETLDPPDPVSIGLPDAPQADEEEMWDDNWNDDWDDILDGGDDDL